MKSDLERRVEAAIEWFEGCTVCEETLENIRKELGYVLDDWTHYHGMKKAPFYLTARFDGPVLVIGAKSRDLS